MNKEIDEYRTSETVDFAGFLMTSNLHVLNLLVVSPLKKQDFLKRTL